MNSPAHFISDCVKERDLVPGNGTTESTTRPLTMLKRETRSKAALLADNERVLLEPCSFMFNANKECIYISCLRERASLSRCRVQSWSLLYTGSVFMFATILISLTKHATGNIKIKYLTLFSTKIKHYLLSFMKAFKTYSKFCMLQYYNLY